MKMLLAVLLFSASAIAQGPVAINLPYGDGTTIKEAADGKLSCVQGATVLPTGLVTLNGTQLQANGSPLTTLTFQNIGLTGVTVPDGNHSAVIKGNLLVGWNAAQSAPSAPVVTVLRVVQYPVNIPLLKLYAAGYWPVMNGAVQLKLSAGQYALPMAMPSMKGITATANTSNAFNLYLQMNTSVWVDSATGLVWMYAGNKDTKDQSAGTAWIVSTLQ